MLKRTLVMALLLVCSQAVAFDIKAPPLLLNLKCESTAQDDGVEVKLYRAKFNTLAFVEDAKGVEALLINHSKALINNVKIAGEKEPEPVCRVVRTKELDELLIELRHPSRLTGEGIDQVKLTGMVKDGLSYVVVFDGHPYGWARRNVETVLPAFALSQVGAPPDYSDVNLDIVWKDTGHPAQRKSEQPVTVYLMAMGLNVPKLFPAMAEKLAAVKPAP